MNTIEDSRIPTSTLKAPPPRSSFSRTRQTKSLSSLPTESKAFVGFLSYEDLPLLPEYYSLPRNSIQISPNSLSVEELSTRINAFLRANSIDCSHDVKEQRLVCSSTHVPRFIIQLWRQTDDNPMNQKIIIEVQRRNGCCVVLHHTRRAFVRSILGPEGRPVKVVLPNFRFTPKKETRELTRCSSSVRRNCLVAAVQLVESKQLDQNRLGMESLVKLTSSNQGSHAVKVAKALVLGNGELGRRLQKSLARRFVDANERWQYDADAAVFCRLTLLALYQSLDLLSKDSASNIRADFDTSPLSSIEFWKGMIEILVERTKLACECPGSAALAVGCIRILERSAPLHFQPVNLYKDLAAELQTAHEYGLQHHASLEQETSQFIHDFCI